MTNLLLTWKQKFFFNMRPELILKRNMCYGVNGRFVATWMVTLYRETTWWLSDFTWALNPIVIALSHLDVMMRWLEKRKHCLTASRSLWSLRPPPDHMRLLPSVDKVFPLPPPPPLPPKICCISNSAWMKWTHVLIDWFIATDKHSTFTTNRPLRTISKNVISGVYL